MNARLTFLVALLASLVLGGCEFGPPAPSGSMSAALANADHKVMVCHHREALDKPPLALSIAVAALKAHLRHGDTLVSDEICDGLDNDCDGVVDPEGLCGPNPCSGDACEPIPCEDGGCEPAPCADDACEPPPPPCVETGCIESALIGTLQRRNAR